MYLYNTIIIFFFLVKQYDNYACYVIVKRDSLIFWSAISYDINILCITINYPTTTKMETIS